MPPEGESARRARIADAEDIASLSNGYLAALTSARGGDAVAERVRPYTEVDRVAEVIERAGTDVFVVGIFDGVIAGFAHAVALANSEDQRRVEVDAMYIDPPLRRVGIGEAMIGEVADFARERRATAIDVISLPGDGATKSFLEATGFRARLLVMHRSTEHS